MIKILLMTLMLLLAYYTCIGMGVLPTGTGTSLRAYGISTASAYVHRQTSPVVALVGTSKSFHVKKEYFQMDTANLGVPAQTTLTGLTIVDGCKKFTPQIVLVELNRFAVRGPADRSVVAYMRNPPTGLADLLHDYRNRPVSVLFTLFKPLLGEPKRERNLIADRWLPIVNPSPQARLYEGQWRDMKASCAQIKTIIDRLERRGARVLLFDAPVDPLVECKGDVETTQYLRQTFPSPEYTWLPMPDGKFETTDLCHLTDNSAERFAKFLEREIYSRGLVAAGNHHRAL